MTDQQTPNSQIEMTLSSASINVVNGTGAVTASITNAAAKPQRIVLRVFGGSYLAPPRTAGQVDHPAATPPSHAPSTPAPQNAPDPASWATVTESLRTIPAGATEQYAVTFNPGSVPGGSYSVKLNAYSADEPPESNSGQILTLELVVPASALPPARKKFPWWIVAAAAGLVAVIAVVAFFLWPKKTQVPTLTGITLEQAKEALADAGLGGKFNPVESTQTPNMVLGQDPEAGASVEPESIVTVDFAAAQTVTVPSVINQLAGAARSGLEDSGLQVSLNPASTCSLNQPRCLVLGQKPEGGAIVPLGSTVLLTVGTNFFTFTLPPNICLIAFCPEIEAKELERFVLP